MTKTQKTHFVGVLEERASSACGRVEPPNMTGDVEAVERATWEAWRNERAARMIVVLAQIPGSSRDRKNKPEWGKQGTFACPACNEGTVRWVRSRSNGHVHAACSTPGCFAIIE